MKSGNRSSLALALAVAATSAWSLAEPAPPGSALPSALPPGAVDVPSASATAPAPPPPGAPSAVPAAESAAPSPAASDEGPGHEAAPGEGAAVPAEAIPSGSESPAAPVPPPVRRDPPPVQPKPAWTWARPSQGPGDAGVEPDRHPPRVPWKGTSFISSHYMTSSMVGVGSDYQSSSHQMYTQGYALLLSYFLYDEEGTALRVAVTPGVEVELTNSDDTDERRELIFSDLPLAVAFATPLYAPEDSLFRTSMGANFTTIVATSKYTRGAGDIATLSPRLSLTQSLPLFGKGAGFLESFQVGVGLRYDHLLSDAEVQVSDDLDSSATGSGEPIASTSESTVSGTRTPRTLQDGAGNTAFSDVLNGARLAPNTYRGSAFVAFADELGIPFELAFGIAYSEARLYEAAEAEIVIATGPVELPPDRGRTARRTVGVSAGLTLFPLTELGLALGYESGADLDGPTPDLFYTPRARFTGAIIVSLDAIYERATGPARSEPFMLY